MVWDIWVRMGHWLVVLLIGFQVYSGEDMALRDWHAWAGIALLVWVVFRIGWGFWGTRHARFADFVGSPRRIIESFKKLGRRQHEAVPGHTHAGGAGVIVLMALIALMAVTGLFASDDLMFDGPLSHFVGSANSSLITQVHHITSKVLILTVLGHVLAIFWHQRLMKEPLIQGMIHGRKAGGHERFGTAVLVRGGLWLLLATLVVVAGLMRVGQFQ